MEVVAPAYGVDQIFLDFDGDVAFTTEPVGAGSGFDYLKHPGLMVTARWVDRQAATRLGRGEARTLTLITELPGDTLLRLDEFRGSASLFARVYGSFVRVSGGIGGPKGDRHMILEQLGSGESLTEDAKSESFEVSTDAWVRVLSVLRPEDRRIVEVSMPSLEPHSELAREVMTKITDAQAAFDAGRYADVARILYVVRDHLHRSGDPLIERYGADLVRNVKDFVHAWGVTMHPERHGGAIGNADRTDRALAMSQLATAKTLAGVYFNG